MTTNTELKIIEGTFAAVSSGNCSQAWMVDGDDIQERANAALNKQYGDVATIYQRGVQGFALSHGGKYLVGVYTTRDAAERALARI
jgi:hypothetical protein